MGRKPAGAGDVDGFSLVRVVVMCASPSSIRTPSFFESRSRLFPQVVTALLAFAAPSRPRAADEVSAVAGGLTADADPPARLTAQFV
jgi:hypothetical protein